MVLVTDIFRLETLQPSDASNLSRLMISNGKRFQKYLPITLSQNISEDASKDYIKKKNSEIQNKTEFTFAIKDKDSNAIAGLVILKHLDYQSKLGEFAYCLGSKYSGNGWMTKSIKAVTDFAFSELQLNTLQIVVHKTNTESVNVAERSGFTWVKTLPKEYVSGKSTLDMELYELHKEAI